MSPDMFDKIKAHRDAFNADKARDDQRKAWSPETQAKVAALEKERADTLKALEKDQERRKPADFKAELQKASLEHPGPALVPKFVSAWRNREAIEAQAEKSLAIKYAAEKTEATREIDRKVAELTKPEREEGQKSPEAVMPDFSNAATNDNWQAEQADLTAKIEAEWEAEAERDEREDDGPEREK